jgi:putative endonuclease
MASYFVYILTNRRYGVLYVGVTNNLMRRLSEHRQKLVPGFTATYGVTKLVYFEEYPSITEARAREHSLKRWHRAWKLKLIDQFNPKWSDLVDEPNFNSRSA